MHIIILNGPPGAGKDTLGSELMKQLTDAHMTVIHGRIKDILYRGTYGRYEGLGSYDEWVTLCNDPILKEIPKVNLKGMSPRGALIYESENIIKPEYGADGVVIQYCNQLRENLPIDTKNVVVVFTDGGFAYETQAISEQFEYAQVDITRITKSGKNFKNDSREYIPNPTYVVDNDTGYDEIKRWADCVIQSVFAPRSNRMFGVKPTIKNRLNAAKRTAKLLSRGDINLTDIATTYASMVRYEAMGYKKY